MTVEKMLTIVMCVIILHHMSVEDRMELDMQQEEEEIYADDIIADGGVTSMWARLVRV